MATYTLSKTSASNTILTEVEGINTYQIATLHSRGDQITTITRGDELVATLRWNLFGKATVTMDGVTRTIDEAFPRSRALSSSRLFTAPDGSGERFKWKYTRKLYCVSESTGLNIATYYRVLFARDKPSTIDISPSGIHLTDLLIVTWAVMGKEAEE